MTGPFRPPIGGPVPQPGQGGPPPVHPTVGNFGLPGGGGPPQGQPYFEPPQQPAGSGWQMPPAPQSQGTFPQQPQQQPQYQAPQPQYQPQQPQYQAPQPQYQPQPQQPQVQNPPQRVEIPDHVVLDGAGVPTELRGRTWGQVKQIYGALANDFVMRQGAPNNQRPQPQQQPVYTQGEPNGGQPVRGQPQRGQGGTFWEDPEASITRIVDSRIAPITQRTTAMAIQEAMNVARMSIPDFAYLEGEIMQIVQGADGQALTDPRLWQSTAELARGRMMGQGRYDSRAAVAQQSPQAQHNPAFARGPGTYVPALANPIPPVGQFFTEAPTPPQFPNGNGNDVQSRVAALTNEQRMYASKMQMSLEDYVMWQGGVVQTAPVRRY